jgi:hypothetical protein
MDIILLSLRRPTGGVPGALRGSNHYHACMLYRSFAVHQLLALHHDEGNNAALQQRQCLPTSR